jgi:hypothetical protein
MAKWTRVQIEVMGRAVGWGSDSRDMSYVAMAESGGDDKVVNSIGCVGLLQINQPVHVGAHPTWSRKWLQDPMNNLRAGLVLFKAAGKKWDGPWLDSRDKGSGGGWGQHVRGGGGGATQAGDDPCELLKGTPAYDYCVGEGGPPAGGGLGGLEETADQIGRLAQAVAKAGNWLSDPANWVRIVYVGGGALLALAAVNVIAQPYAARAYRQVVGALPVKTAKDVARQVRPNPKSEE